MGVPNKFDRLGAITTNKLPKGYIQAEGIKFSDAIQLSVNVTDSRKPTEMVSDFCVLTQPNEWLSILGYWDDSNQCYNRLGVSHSNYVPVADSNKVYYRKQSRSNKLTYMQGLVLHKWYTFHAFADGKILLNKELYQYEDVGSSQFQYSLLNLNFMPWIERVYGHQAFVYDGNMQFDLYPCITPSGVAAFFDKVKNEVLLVSSPIAYLTRSQALELSKLPTGEGALTVSLPWEAQWDTGVQSALQIAADNGWTITVQYRDPEVATTNIPASFLESTGTQGLILPIAANSESVGFECDAQITDMHYGATGVNAGGCYFFWGVSGSGSNSSWYGGLGSTVQRNNGAPDMYRHHWQGKVSATTGYIKCDDTLICQGSGHSSAVYSFGVFCTNDLRYLQSVRFFMLKLYRNENMIYNLIPCLDAQGAPCMYDRSTKQSFYNRGSGSFVVGFDTVKQALKLATLPDVTAETDTAKKSLTVSLPWEAQLVSTGVPAALQIATDRGWTITVQYRDPEVDNAYYNKYAACTTHIDMKAVNPDYKNDLTVDDEWVYPLPKLQTASWAFNTFEKCKAWLVDLPSLTRGDFMLVRYAGALFDRALPLLENGESMFRNMVGRKTFKSALPKLKNGTNMFSCIAIYGIIYLSFESDLPMLEKGSGMFNLNALDKTSVLRICNSIPTWTDGAEHPLTLGIHIDHQNDADIDAATAVAEEKGWTVSVQWNGTATAQSTGTFGLRKPPIYAKPYTTERQDGTTEQVLDWGHYVTNWEENGYQEFASVEEAEEYFNINQAE